ncbi:hypothetical protein SAMN05216378_4898 [Paenibacillus catalpae]|uniref:Uncharacterized protein n=1 Tax=Paenibacillus catalpae TaxID=1045775 RepID=A0A1I2FIZ7_9BACL|nr:hypothetical protein [Paenibacillus catalpae]SFF05444.1 hypothetical protein SAMN05216378_4898 [Paenibacillus catalpae]
MNLSDMLGYADIQQLSRIASVYQCECNGHSKNDLIQSILSTVSRKDVFEAQISSMKLDEMRFLNSLLFESRDSFSLEELIARVQQSKFGEVEPPAEEPPQKKTKRTTKKKKAEAEVPKETGPREMISRFKHQGWLFNGVTGVNRYMFQVPQDLRTRFRDTLRKKFAAELHFTDEPQMYRDEQLLVQEDIYQLLHYIYHNEVQLSADGSMYKRFSGQILEKLAISEEFPAKGEWRFGYGRHFHHYPNRMSLLYDYCSYMKYFTDNNLVLTLSTSGEERLRSKPANEMEQLYKFWLKLYKGPISNVHALVHWMNSLAEQWVTVDSLRKVLIPFIKPFYYDTADKVLDVRLIGIMVHLGMLRIGEHQEHGTVVRMTKLGRALIAGVSLEDQDRMFLY